MFLRTAASNSWPSVGYKQVLCGIGEEPEGFLFAVHDWKKTDYSYNVRTEEVMNYKMVKGEDHRLFGSFCPDETAIYDFRAAAFNCAGVLVNTSLNKKGSNQNEWEQYQHSYLFNEVSNVNQPGEFLLYKNMCYGFQMVGYSYGSTKALFSALYRKKDDPDWHFIPPKLGVACEKNECRIGFYGSDCTNVCDLKCESGGVCDPVDGIGCRCKAGSFNNAFCENTNEEHFYPSSDQKVKIEIMRAERVLSTAYSRDLDQIYLPPPSNMIPYSTIRASGKIRITQNSDFSFKLPKRSLFSIGTTIIHSGEQNPFHCTQTNEEIEVEKLQLKSGEYEYLFEYHLGCSFNTPPNPLSIKWKYHRWHLNQPSSWESIPSRYLGVL